jgi:hypothetical protein
VIAQTLGSDWSISCINRAVNPPVVQSKFIRVSGYPNLTSANEDNGTTPYPLGPGLFRQARAALARLFS